MNKTGLVSLLQSPHIWRVGDMPRLERTGWPTGFDELDKELPEGGWPKHGLTELLCDRTGMGEVSLLLPALAALATRQRCIAWINPPFLPYAPTLNNAGVDLAQILVVRPTAHPETLWAAEQVLRSGATGAALLWLSRDVDYANLRRLHLAAEAGRSSGFLYRRSTFAAHPSPAPLRIHLAHEPNKLAITLLKRRGLMGSRRIDLTSSMHGHMDPPMHLASTSCIARH